MEEYMKKVLVTGGTGTLGSRVVKKLITMGYTPKVMSRNRQPTHLLADTEWVQVDLDTGQGLVEAVHDIDVIVHAASNPFHPQKTDTVGTKLLLEAARNGGVDHIAYISIVGIDRIPFPYYQQKLAAEEMIKSSGIPWSILRATQFHPFIDLLLNAATKLPLVAILPTDFKFQPIDVNEVVARMCEIVATGLRGRLPDLGGPEVLTVSELARTWLSLRGMHRVLLPLWLPGKVAHGFRHGYHTCPDKPLRESITWREWVQKKYRPEAKTR